MRILSLGAGVQSSTVALMMVKGEIEVCDHAIFADTKAEGIATYKYLDWLKDQFTFPLHIVTKSDGLTSNLNESCLNNKHGENIPAFLADGGMLTRQCTSTFKIIPIVKKIRELGGSKKNPVIQYQGISADEKLRMKINRLPWITNKYPLIELGMSRGDCLRWMAKNNYPSPPRSACVYCPFKCNAEWEKLKNIYPFDFAEAVRVDKMIRCLLPSIRERGKHKQNFAFVHRDLKPLDEIDFSEDYGQGNLFENDCEGMCGV